MRATIRGDKPAVAVLARPSPGAARADALIPASKRATQKRVPAETCIADSFLGANGRMKRGIRQNRNQSTIPAHPAAFDRLCVSRLGSGVRSRDEERAECRVLE